MEQRDVLSVDSVDRIRVYVKHKYHHLPREKHAEIVADAIVKIIERQLPEFEATMKQQICQALIQDIVIKEKRPVSLHDIDTACTSHIEQLFGSDAAALEQFEQWRTQNGMVLSEHEPEWDKLLSRIQSWFKRSKRALMYACGCLVIMLAAYGFSVLNASSLEHALPAIEESDAVTMVNAETSLPSNELPRMYQYAEVDRDKLKAYLDTRQSKLVEEPYFDALLRTAKEFNISPILLFAITGQEQGFVHREHEQAERIANNPFNVFHSWQDYNTTIEDSAAIAARTIVNLSKDRPEGVDAIVWINRKYAEDPNWSTGVLSLFETITAYISNDL